MNFEISAVWMSMLGTPFKLNAKFPHDEKQYSVIISAVVVMGRNYVYVEVGV
jgi:hypothetical protein